MSKQIWKYQLQITDEQIISVPAGSRPISVAEQNGKLCMWAIVGSNRSAKMRIQVVGTGNPMPDVGDYIGTVVMGKFVWHVFAEEVAE